MGGPGACVLVRNALTEQQSESLDAWLQSITSTRDNEDSNVYSFWLKDDVFPETVSNCLFYLAKDNASDVAEDDMRQQLIEKLGYIPQRAISLGSGCNQDSDHRTLGRLVLHLAEVYHGLIDMGGAITPPLQRAPLSKVFFIKQRSKVEERKAYLHAQFDALEATLPPGTILRDYLKEHYSDPDSPFKKIAADIHDKFGSLLPPHSEPSFEEISAFVQGMPGKVYEIYYETARETQWVYHIVDTTFLRAWLNHPHFHMIK